jgi:hypothetical protein
MICLHSIINLFRSINLDLAVVQKVMIYSVTLNQLDSIELLTIFTCLGLP